MPDPTVLLSCHPDVVAFKDYITKNLENGIIADADGLRQTQFLPFFKLKEYYTANSNDKLKRLVYACCPSSRHCSPAEIVNAIVEPGYMIGFATLLMIDEGSHIRTIYDRRSLSDLSIPSKGPAPEGFPISANGPNNQNMWERFKSQQKIFKPATIGKTSQKIDPECILPITFIEEIEKSGGSADTFKIAIHPAYNRLDRDSASSLGEEHVETYCLKIFRPLNQKVFEDERHAYRHIRSQNKLNSAFVRYHTSLETAIVDDHRLLSIVIEYANGGTLEELFQSDETPQTPADIANFWIRLCAILQGLELLNKIRNEELDSTNYLTGWHQDVKPPNILRVLSKEGTVYESTFKLIDLGLAHLRQSTGSSTQGHGGGGSRVYGAPEIYTDHPDLMRMPRVIFPSVDIWSFGCVLFEAVVWVVGGMRALKAFRVERQKETRAHDVRDVGAFHDGNKILPCVETLSSSIPAQIKRGDNITPQVLEIVSRFMLREVGARCSARFIQQEWRKVKIEAERIARGDGPLTKSTSMPVAPTSSPIPMPEPFFNQPPMTSPTEEPGPEGSKSPPPDPEEQLPRWSVDEASLWMDKRRGKRKYEKPKIPNDAFRNDLKGPKGRDYIFLIDDSRTMREHWPAVASTVELLSEIVVDQKADKEIDVRFVGIDDKRTSGDSSVLKKFVEDRKPPDQSDRILNPANALSELLDKYVNQLRVPRFRRSLSRRVKPISLYIVTDGRYRPKSDFKTPISRAIDNLEKLNKLGHLGIQFLQVGDHSEGGKRLAFWDKYFGSTVDTEPITGDVWKMLLGALDPDFDDDSDVEEGEIRKVEREATVGRLSLEPGSSAASVGPATLPYRNTSPIRGPPSAWNRLSGFWGKR